MGRNSSIEWTHHTFNPWIGCTKVSAGCQFCYAEEQMDKRWGKVKWGPAGTRVRTSPAYWTQPMAWDKAAANAGERHRVFCASLADVFEERSDLVDWRAELTHLIRRCRNLDWLLLTKRPGRVNALLKEATGWEPQHWLHDNRHVWIGTSVEHQDAAYERVPQLLGINAAVRFLSLEPLLGPVDLHRSIGGLWLGPDGIGWGIVGGESGPHARPMSPAWARQLRDQLVGAGVPFLFKQWGEWAPNVPRTDVPDGARWGRVFPDGRWTEYPQDASVAFPTKAELAGECMVRVGKKAAGRLLDGVEWSQFPNGRSR